MSGNLFIFRIILIQFVQFLKPFQFVLVFLKIVVLDQKFVNLRLQRFVLFLHLLECLEVIAHVSHPLSDPADPFLHRNDSQIGSDFKRSGDLSGKYGKQHQKDTEQRQTEQPIFICLGCLILFFHIISTTCNLRLTWNMSAFCKYVYPVRWHEDLLPRRVPVLQQRRREVPCFPADRSKDLSN